MTADTDFETFAATHLRPLLRYAIVLTGDRELGHDLVQDVMVAAFRQWPRVAAADRPDRYVRTMLTHAFLSWRRRWSVRHIFATDTLPDVPGAEDIGTELTERDDLWRRMAALAPRQRAVLVLRYYERLSDNEIAEVLGCSATTVRGYAHRALASLRLDMADSGAQPTHALEGHR